MCLALRMLCRHGQFSAGFGMRLQKEGVSGRPVTQREGTPSLEPPRKGGRDLSGKVVGLQKTVLFEGHRKRKWLTCSAKDFRLVKNSFFFKKKNEKSPVGFEGNLSLLDICSHFSGGQKSK